MKSLLDIGSLSKKEVSDIFSVTSSYLIDKRDDLLLGKQIVIGFFESSTRTRISFDLAVQRMGGKTIQFLAQGSSISKGESFVDTIHTLNQFGIASELARDPASPFSLKRGAPRRVGRARAPPRGRPALTDS